MFDFDSLKDSGLNVDDHVLKLATALSGVFADVLVTWGMPSDKSNALVTAITIITVLLIAGISHVQANKLKAQGAVAAAEKKPPETQAVQLNNAPPAQPFTPDQLDFIYAEVARRANAHAKTRAAAVQPPIHDVPKGS